MIFIRGSGMLSFRYWLELDEVFKEISRSVFLETAQERAISKFLQFVSAALHGSVIEEAVEEDAEEGSKSWTMETALKMQDLARRVRWSAMIDRAEAVDQIKEVLEDKWKPFMAERRSEVVREYERQRKSGLHDSDEDIRRAVGDKMGLTTYEVGRIISDQQNEWSVIKEADDWAIPGLDEDDKDLTDAKLAEIVKASGYPLIKLGYLKEGQLNIGDRKEQIRLLDKAIRSAAAETGNEPEENETTKMLKSNALARREATRDLMQLMYETYQNIARSSYYKSSKSMGSLGKDAAGSKGGRRGSEHFQGEEDILSMGIESLINSLTRRKPNQDGTVPEWQDIMTLSGTSVPEIMGSIATRFRTQNITRDAIRDQKKAGGLSGSSSDSVQNLGSGAKQDDGSIGSIDPADARTTDSLTAAANSTTTSEILEAFKKAMAEVRQIDPLWAMLICSRYELNCGPDGSMPDASANRLLSLLTGAGSIGLTQTPENFFKRMASSGMPSERAAEDLLAQKAQKYWDLLKDKKAIKKGGLRRSAPAIGSKEEAKTKAESDDWSKFVHTVRDACGEAESWLWRRMNELMSETGAKTAGQVGHRTWSMARFLRSNFRGATMQVTDPAPNEQNIKISFPASAGNSAKTYDILVTDNKNISIMQDGFEDENEFEIPDQIRCPYCNGAQRGCAECEGDGFVLDVKAISKLEYDIRQVLSRSRRNVKSKT